jgi:hypothetical protein
MLLDGGPNLCMTCSGKVGGWQRLTTPTRRAADGRGQRCSAAPRPAVTAGNVTAKAAPVPGPALSALMRPP